MLRMGFSLLILCSVLSAGNARAEGKVGNGGDELGIEFKMIANDVYVRLLSSYPQGMQQIDLELFIRTARHATIESVESDDIRLLLRGIKKEAVNYPDDNLIIIDRNTWQQKGYFAKATLVFHEVISLMGIDDANYRLSSIFYDYILKSNDFATLTIEQITRTLVKTGWPPKSPHFNNATVGAEIECKITYTASPE